MSKLIYKDIDTFMIRTSTLSMENYSKLFDKQLSDQELNTHLLE